VRACDFAGSGAPLTRFDNQPAAPASIGMSIDAAMTATTASRPGRAQKPETANFVPDESNPHAPCRVSFRSRVMHVQRQQDLNRIVDCRKMTCGLGDLCAEPTTVP